MIKKFTINKAVIICMYIILLSIFYLIPTNNIKTSVNIDDNKELNLSSVYLLDNDDYLSKVTIYYDQNTIVDEIRNKIEILINGVDYMNDFYPLIPKNTKINSLKVNEDNVYIDFSKELLNVNKYLEEKMIESIVYTISDINGINNIYINVDGIELKTLPNSKKEIPYPLNRNIGINKKYDINSFNDVSKTTIYFSKKYNNESYYVPVTFINNDNKDKINIIIEELKSSVNSQNKLNGIINSNIELDNYNIDNNKMNIVFNKEINNNKITNVIAYSIFENYNIDEVVFKNLDNNNTTILRK